MNKFRLSDNSQLTTDLQLVNWSPRQIIFSVLLLKKIFEGPMKN